MLFVEFTLFIAIDYTTQSFPGELDCHYRICICVLEKVKA
jgi:hypothetical protein